MVGMLRAGDPVTWIREQSRGPRLEEGARNVRGTRNRTGGRGYTGRVRIVGSERAL